jgi:hypothetical protein
MESYKDLEAVVAVSKFLDMASNVIVKNTSESDLISTAQIAHFTEWLSTAYRPYNVDLDSYVSITEMNILDLIYNLIQAPISTLNCIVIQDAYIRESRPTLNYGDSPFLLLGNPVEGSYQFVVQIDTKPYNNLQNSLVLDANLVFHLSSTFNTNISIDVYEVSESWNESTITWSNFNPTLSAPLTSFVCNSSTVKINILDYLNQTKLLGKDNINLYFKVNSPNIDLFYFDSKEATEESIRPKIEIRYQDPSWTGFTDNGDLDSISTIRTSNARDIHSTVTIRKTLTHDLNSNSVSRRSNVTDILSNTVIRQSGNIDLSSVVSINPNISIDSNAIIRQNDYLDLISTSNLYISSDLDSIANVNTMFEWLDGNAIIRRVDNTNLPSSVIIRNNLDLDSSALTRLQKLIDLESSAKSRLSSYTNIEGNAVIRQLYDLLSTVIARRNTNVDLNAIARVRNSGELDLSSSIVIGNNVTELSSVARIPNKGSTELNSVGYTYIGTSIDSSVVVRSASIDSSNDLSSSARIRLTESNDIVSGADVYQNLNLSSSLRVRLTKLTELMSTANIKSVSDLESGAIILQICDLISSVNVRNTDILDMLSSGIVRQFDIEEIQSIVHILGLEVVDLVSLVNIQRYDTNYLSGVAEIKTTARRWIPNIHANDIFDYQDRKLPRVWNRENFIPN